MNVLKIVTSSASWANTSNFNIFEFGGFDLCFLQQLSSDIAYTTPAHHQFIRNNDPLGLAIFTNGINLVNKEHTHYCEVEEFKSCPEGDLDSTQGRNWQAINIKKLKIVNCLPFRTSSIDDNGTKVSEEYMHESITELLKLCDENTVLVGNFRNGITDGRLYYRGYFNNMKKDSLDKIITRADSKIKIENINQKTLKAASNWPVTYTKFDLTYG